MVNIITPLLTQFGVGGIGGLCVGFAIKKVAKIVAVFIGLAFLGLEYLAYVGIISINYDALTEWANSMVAGMGVLEGILTAIIANLPFAASFTLGFAAGFKYG